MNPLCPQISVLGARWVRRSSRPRFVPSASVLQSTPERRTEDKQRTQHRGPTNDEGPRTEDRRATRSFSLSNKKTSRAAGRHVLTDAHVLDARGGRALPEMAFEPEERVAISLREHLDLTISQISDPSAHTVARGGFLHEESKSDA